MPKLTVFEKKETGSQTGINNSSKESSITIQKPDLLEIPLFNSEKPETISHEKTQNKVLTPKMFNEYLIQAIDEALTSLGQPVKNTVYMQLETKFNITKNEIPYQIEEFTNIMHNIFGLGASRLEIKFMKNLYSKIKVNAESQGCEWPLSKWIIDDISFTDYIQKTREEYCSCNENIELLQKTEDQSNLLTINKP